MGSKAWVSGQPWASLVVRVAAGLILIIAGLVKVRDLDETIRAVRAYRFLPEAIVPLVGSAMPYLEIVVGVGLVFGVFTRVGAVLYSLSMVAFLVGLAWVWTKGYSIDCGCFGGGGEVDPSKTNYPSHLVRDLGFLSMGVFLYAFPRSKYSVDGWLEGDVALQPDEALIAQ